MDLVNPQHPGAPDALLAQAEVQFRAALALAPKTPDALHLLITTAHRTGLHAVARELLNESPPDDPRFLAARAAIERDEGNVAAAIDALSTALTIMPNDAQTHAALADMFRRVNRLPDARHHAATAITLAPDNPAGHVALAVISSIEADYTHAESSLRHALTLDPHHAAAHRHLAHLLFLQGNFADAYPHYEHRWNLPGFRGTFDRLAVHQWTGDPLGTRTLLLHAEQGLGDTLMMLRYLPLIPKQNGRILLQVQPPLQRLLANFSNADQVLARGEPVPPFDLHCPLLSLPRVFNTALDTIPTAVPYLAMPPSPKLPNGPHIGLAWSGNPLHPGDCYRSIPFSLLTPLLDLPLQFHRMHKPGPAESLVGHPHLHDPTPRFDDFADTAAYIHSLDLVISVDTAVAHLAGALGKPTWLLLPYSPDWRWMVDRPDSPWYPAMRLFRQPWLNDWPAVIASAVDALQSIGNSR